MLQNKGHKKNALDGLALLVTYPPTSNSATDDDTKLVTYGKSKLWLY